MSLATLLLTLVRPQEPAKPARDERLEVGPDPTWDLERWKWSGEIALGWRSVGIDGSRAQAREDLNLETGPLLRDLLVRGEGGAGGEPRSLLLEARGIGDPQSSLRAELEAHGARATARVDRTEFEGATDSDLHALEVRHDTGSLRFEPAHTGEADSRTGFELTYARREAFVFGTRSVDFGFVSDVPTRVDDRVLGARGTLAVDLDGWDLELTGGLEHLASDDRRNFSGASPSDPLSLQTEDYRADRAGFALLGGVRLARDFDAKAWRVDGGVDFERSELDGDLHSLETGILFSPLFPFVRVTDGDANAKAARVSADAGVRCELSPELALSARVSHDDERDRGDLARTITLDELSGPPSTSIVQDRTRFESRLDLVELGAELALAPWADLDLTLEGGREQLHVLETSFGTPLRAFDGPRERIGGEAALELDPNRELHLTLSTGVQVAPTASSKEGSTFDFRDDRGRFASVRARWRFDPRWSLLASARRQESDREAFGSQNDSTTLSLGASGAPREGWTLSASCAVRNFDLETDITELVLTPGPVLVPGKAEFRGTQTILAGSLSAVVTPSFEPRIDWSALAGTGDGEFRYGSLGLDLPVQLAKALWIGAELDLRSFDGRETIDVSDYDATVVFLYLRTGF
jgi:hypothetical protein